MLEKKCWKKGINNRRLITNISAFSRYIILIEALLQHFQITIEESEKIFININSVYL